MIVEFVGLTLRARGERSGHFSTFGAHPTYLDDVTHHKRCFPCGLVSIFHWTTCQLRSLLGPRGAFWLTLYWHRLACFLVLWLNCYYATDRKAALLVLDLFIHFQAADFPPSFTSVEKSLIISSTRRRTNSSRWSVLVRSKIRGYTPPISISSLLNKLSYRFISWLTRLYFSLASNA